MRLPIPPLTTGRRWRAWLIALLLVGGQLGGWLHLAAHHAGKTSAHPAIAATVGAPAAEAFADVSPDGDENCLICLGLASFSMGLIARWATLRPSRLPLRHDGAPPVRLTTLAALTPLARGPPRFS